MENKFKTVIRISLFLGVSWLAGCDKQINQETGLLEGTIHIGPICPVETDPPDPGCLPTAETYKAFPVYILATDGSGKMLISPATDGSFKIELVAGNYFIVLEKEPNGIGSSNLPFEVTIKPSEETIISIEIDTGIR